MHRLSSSFVLGYHGCDQRVGEKLLSGADFRRSNNEYDWLGPGVYFRGANPYRAHDFAIEAARREGSRIRKAFVVGAVLDLGLCFDLTTKTAIDMLRIAFQRLEESANSGELTLPKNSSDLLRRPLDCAVIRRVHTILAESDSQSIDSVKGVFTEGKPAFPGAGFLSKTHTQIAICNPASIKGVFRVSPDEYR